MQAFARFWEVRLTAASLVALLAAGCGGAGGGSGDWYYHWNCNGDSQCLATNPTGQPIGTRNEGPVQVACTQLMQFAIRFWGPTAYNSCDQSAAFPVLLMSITVSPSNSSLPIGSTRQFTATGRYTDGTSRDLTAQVAWTAVTTSGGPGVATIAGGGLATAVAQGTATIAAALGAVSGSTTLTVGPVALVKITVAPPNPTIAKGQSQAFTATGQYSDGSAKDLTAMVSWASATPAVATINPSGLAAGVGAGSAVITASLGAISGSTTLTVTGPVVVSIAVLPANPTVARTYSRALRAVGTYSDGTSQDVTGTVTWASGTPAVATVNPGGLATGVAAGLSSVTAALGSVSGQTTLTVTTASLVSITVTPALPRIAPTATVALTAIGHFSDSTAYALTAGVTWTSATQTVATVDAKGLATGVAVGTSQITAAYGVSGSATLTVTMTPPGVTWNYQPTGVTYPPGSNGWLFSVGASGSLFVAGDSYALVTSPDGVAWTLRSPGANFFIRGVIFAPELGLWVAVGGGFISTSTDGATWVANNSGPIAASALNGVTWSGTQFVAVGDNGVVLTSPDGMAWTAQTSGTSLKSVVWSGVQFVAVGAGTLVSPDGKKWTAVEVSGGWSGVAWSGSQFVKVSQNGYIETSADGVTWTDRTTVGTPPGYGVIWADTQFVAVGGNSGDGYVATSPDGVTWTRRTLGTAGTPSGTSQQLFAVAWSGTKFVAVGVGGYIWTSQ